MPEGPPPRLRYLVTAANAQPAVAAYALDPPTGRYRAVALDVLTLRGERIGAVTAFRATGLLDQFGLPNEIDA
jgi:RNA polymerase sigma-70 factor (ECF subfamily)